MTAKRLMPAVGAAGIRRELQDFDRSSSLPLNSPPSSKNKEAAKQNPDQVQALVRQFQFDDDKAVAKSALDRLCQIYERLVKTEANRWWRHSVGKRSKTASRDQEIGRDLQQAAMIGLIKAIDRYRSQLGASLPAYAKWWIRDELRQASRRHIEWCRVASLNDCVGADGDGDEHIDLLPERTTSSPEAAVLTKQTARIVDAALATIDSRARRILLARSSAGSLTYAEIAVELGLSSERVRQIEEKARGKIKRHLEHSLGGSEVPTVTDDKVLAEGCRNVRSNGGCDLDEATESAQVTLQTGKLRKVSRAKAASDVRKIEVTADLAAFYEVPLQIAIQRCRRPFFERTIDSPGAAKIFPLPSARRMGAAS